MFVGVVALRYQHHTTQSEKRGTFGSSCLLLVSYSFIKAQWRCSCIKKLPISPTCHHIRTILLKILNKLVQVCSWGNRQFFCKQQLKNKNFPLRPSFSKPRFAVGRPKILQRLLQSPWGRLRNDNCDIVMLHHISTGQLSEKISFYCE